MSFVWRCKFRIVVVYRLVEHQLVGTSTSSSVVGFGEDIWPFSRVSISCRMAILNLSRELSTEGSALNIEYRISSGIFFRRMGINKLP